MCSAGEGSLGTSRFRWGGLLLAFDPQEGLRSGYSFLPYLQHRSPAAARGAAGGRAGPGRAGAPRRFPRRPVGGDAPSAAGGGRSGPAGGAALPRAGGACLGSVIAPAWSPAVPLAPHPRQFWHLSPGDAGVGGGRRSAGGNPFSSRGSVPEPRQSREGG